MTAAVSPARDALWIGTERPTVIASAVASLDAILQLAALFPVFPCRPRDETVAGLTGPKRMKAKSPYTKRGFQDASQDPAIITEWWKRWPDALVGVPTGAVTRIAALDFDSYKASDEANAWIAEHTDVLMTTRAHTTLSGGRHYLFRLPPGARYQSGTDLVLAGAARRGIDLRAEGGYIIWWPMHGSAKTGDAVRLPAGLIDERLMVERELEELPPASPSKWQVDEPLVADALAYIDPHARDTWRDMGMAIHYASGGSASGFQLWHAWSAGELTGELPHNYSGVDDCRYHWSSFRHNKDRAHTVTLGTLFSKARANGYTGNQKQGRLAAPELGIAIDSAAPDTPSSLIEARAFEWIDPKDIRPRPWLLGRHYMRGMVTATAGIGGAGKTSLLIVEAISQAIGRDLLRDGKPLDVGPLPVWLHNGEDPYDELQRRVIACCLKYEVSREELGNRLFITSGRDMPIIVAQELEGSKVMVPTHHGTELKAEIAKRGIAVFVADPFVTLHRVSENDNVMIDAVMSILRDIAHETHCAFELAHHFRKVAGGEPSVDDVRGASSIVGACRSVRIVAGMSKDDAEALEIEQDERKGYAWIQNGKANMLPPTLSRQWLKLESVGLDNACHPYAADSVGVVVSWVPPAKTYHLTAPEFRAVRLAIQSAEQPLNDCRRDVRSAGWVGLRIAKALEMDPADKAVKAKVKQLIAGWEAKGLIRIESLRDPRQARVIDVVRWAETEEV